MTSETDRTLALSTAEQPAVGFIRSSPRREVPKESRAAPAAVEKPEQIGRYSVIRTLGAGAMGVVYSAYDEELDRRVAIKLLRTDLCGRSRTRGLSRMRREAQALAKLSHPNVVQVYDVGEFRGQIFLAMEYIRGQTLGSWLRGASRDRREILDKFVQAGRGLAAAHAAGLIHRDFKPENVIVGDDDRVRVLDFGVARADASDDLGDSALFSSSGTSVRFRAELTEAGMLIGTPAYMAPEQFEGRPVDARTDIFGFCVTLYEALYGFRPFQGEGVDELRAEVLAGELPEVAEERGVPARLHRILVRGLQPDPELRYPSMDALLVDLSHDGAAARRRILFIVLAVVVLACVAVTVAVVSSRSSAETGPSCDAAAVELGTLYNPARRERIGATILASSVSFAGSTWERVAPRLDDYAEAWTGARVDACEAHLEGRQSPRLFDLRTACLDQRRAGFAALLDVFENADDAAIAKLAEAVLALPRLDPCADTEALTAAIAPPEDVEVATAVQRLRERLAEVKAYESTGRYEQATALLDPLQAKAEGLSYPPVEIEVLLRRGILSMWQFHFEAAEKTLSDAFYLAIAKGHDPAAADALSRLLYIRSTQDAKGALGQRRLGDALIERIKGSDEIIATYYNNVGVLAMLAGEHQAARDAYRQSLEIKRRIYGDRHLEVAYTLSNLGALDETLGYYEPAIGHFSEAVEIFQETLGPQHFNTGALMGNLANAYSRGGRWDDAEKSYVVMKTIFAGAPEVWAGLGPHILPGYGDYQRSRHRLDEAARDYAELLSLGEATGEDVAAILRARVGLAAIAVERRRWEDAAKQLDAIDSVLKGQESQEGADGLPHRRAETYDLRGRLLGAEGGELSDRLALHTKAFDLRRLNTPAGSPLRARSHLIFAEALIDCGGAHEAEEHLRDARTIIEAQLSPQSLERQTLELLAGRSALAQGEEERAASRFRRAEELLGGVRDEDDFDYVLIRLELAHALWQADERDSEARELAAHVGSILDADRAAYVGLPESLTSWLKDYLSEP